MLKIRLQRVGKKGTSSFRLVLTDSHNSTKSGKYLEVLGNYDPRNDLAVNKPDINGDRIKHWISQGAQVTDTVHNLLINLGIISGKKINVLPQKTVPQAEELKEEAKKEEATVSTEATSQPPQEKEEEAEKAPPETVATT